LKCEGWGSLLVQEKYQEQQACGKRHNNNNNNKANRPDIIIKNKKEKTCILMEVAIPVERNFVQKEEEKKL